MKKIKVILEDDSNPNLIGEIKVSSSEIAHRVFRIIWDLDIIELLESVYILYLNKNNVIIGHYRLSIGGIDSTVIDRRIVFAIGLACGASAFIIAHNHPSGNLTLSQQDITITKLLIESGRLMDIKCLDHLILTANDYVSLADTYNFENLESWH